MNKIIQTRNTCGQSCVAVILEITLDDSITIFGHSNPTTSKDIMRALNLCGIECSELKPISRKLPDVAIIKKKVPNKDALHWILKIGEKVYDPSNGRFYNYSDAHNGFGRDGKYIEVYENKRIQTGI